MTAMLFKHFTFADICDIIVSERERKIPKTRKEKKLETLINRYVELINRNEARRVALNLVGSRDAETFRRIEHTIEHYTCVVYDLCELANKEVTVEYVTETFMGYVVNYAKTFVR